MITLTEKTIIQSDKTDGNTTLTFFDIPGEQQEVFIEKGLIKGIIEVLTEVDSQDNGLRIIFKR